MKVEKAACFKRGHCARAGQKHALKLQPGVGERSTAACSYFLHCVRARQKNVLWFQPGVGGKKQNSPSSFSSLRARRTETRGFVPALFFLVPAGSGGKKHSRLFSFFNAREQDRKMRTGPSGEYIDSTNCIT